MTLSKRRQALQRSKSAMRTLLLEKTWTLPDQFKNKTDLNREKNERFEELSKLRAEVLKQDEAISTELITAIDPSKLTKAQVKKQLVEAIQEYDRMEESYWLMSVDLEKIPQQGELVKTIQETFEEDWLILPQYKFTLYQWGNWAGKTFIWAFISVCKALWNETEKYWLPYLWSPKKILIWTKSGQNVKTVIEDYLLAPWSLTRIPPEEIKKNWVKRDNGILKSVHLKNGCVISVATYDQGQEVVQWATPDFIWLDEEPRKRELWQELFMRAREPECQILITMTPLWGFTPVYEAFYEQKDEKVKKRQKIFLVSSLDNVFADNEILMWMLDEDSVQSRIEWKFSPPAWLVFKEWRRTKHLIPYFHPEKLGEGVRYYWAIDFWVNHPTALLFIAVDQDENVYVYDMLYGKNIPMKEISKRIKAETRKRKLERIIADSASWRERLELAEYWIRTEWAIKRSKHFHDNSTRRAGIIKVNRLLQDNKLYVSTKCDALAREIELHSYKEWGKRDGEVEKINDDALDALRYFIFNYFKPWMPELSKKTEYKKLYWVFETEKDLEIWKNDWPY